MNAIAMLLEKYLLGVSWRTSILGVLIVISALLGDLGNLATQIGYLFDGDPATIFDAEKVWLIVAAILYLFKSKAQADVKTIPVPVA